MDCTLDDSCENRQSTESQCFFEPTLTQSYAEIASKSRVSKVGFSLTRWLLGTYDQAGCKEM